MKLVDYMKLPYTRMVQEKMMKTVTIFMAIFWSWTDVKARAIPWMNCM